jgi:hypothetical protein
MTVGACALHVIWTVIGVFWYSFTIAWGEVFCFPNRPETTIAIIWVVLCIAFAIT